ncbi:MAG: hypothetical protein ACFB20_10740 [Opitutales bacterium]
MRWPLAQSLPDGPLELVEDTRFLAPTANGWPWWGYVLLVLGVVAVGVLGFLIGRYGQRWLRRRNAEPGSPGSSISPEEWALQQLRALRGDLNVERGYDFTIEVSRILRHYIEQRHGIFAPRMTSREFLQAATQWTPFPDFAVNSLQRFMSICDGTKFARKRVQEEQMRILLDTAERFVRQSAPVPSQAEAGATPRPLAGRES